MNPELTTLIQQQIPRMPKALLGVLQDPQTSSTLKAIVDRHTLTQGQASVVQSEIVLLLVGLTDPRLFSKTLKERLGLDGAAFTTLMDDLDTEVLSPIYGVLVRFYDAEQAEFAPVQESTEVTKTPPKPPVAKQPPTPPDNLPTGEDISNDAASAFLPTIKKDSLPPQEKKDLPTPESATPDPHVFEKTLQKKGLQRFTPQPQAMEALHIPESPKPDPAASLVAQKSTDPYREPIEI